VLRHGGHAFWLEQLKIAGALQVETRWRHQGLLEELIRVGERPPWLRGALEPQDESLRKIQEADLETANVVDRIVSRIARQQLASVVNAALEFTPVKTLVDLGILIPLRTSLTEVPAEFRPQQQDKERTLEWARVRARAPLVRAHSFERLRLAYSRAFARAKL
jgi:hypothetical protein